MLSIEFSLLFVLLTLILSIASYYGVERVFRTKRTNKKQAFGWGLLAAGVLGISQAMAKVNAVFTPEQLPMEYRRYADPETICHGKIVGDCLKGDLTSDREVLVLGDSHAAMLNQFFEVLGKDLGFKARIITASSCVTIPRFDYERISAWAHKACLAQIESAKKFIVKSDIIFIAGMWSYQTGSEEFKKAFRDFLNNNDEKRIIVLSQVPRFNRNVIRIRRFLELGFSGSFARDESYQIGNKSIEEITKKHTNVEFLLLDKIQPFDDAPFYQDKLIYIDGHHINEVGARAYAGFVTPLFKELLIRN